MANAFVNEKDGKYAVTISKIDCLPTIYFDRAAILTDENGTTLYANVTQSSGLTTKIDDKWVEFPAAKLPAKMLFSFPRVNKDKEKLLFAEALHRYVTETKSEHQGKVSGCLTVSNASPLVVNYANGDDYSEGDNLTYLRIKHLDLKPFEGELELGEIPKVAAYGRSGSSAQKQSEIIADRMAFLNSLEEGDLRVKVTSGFIAANSIATELGQKPMVFTDYLSSLLA